MSKKGSIGKFVAGAAIGAGLALLFAPEKGEKTRAKLKKKATEVVDKVKDIDVEKKIAELKNDLKDLDQEKVKSVIKEKSEKLLKKADELLSVAKEKAEPALENVALDVKHKTKEILQKAVDKLDDEPKKM